MISSGSLKYSSGWSSSSSIYGVYAAGARRFYTNQGEKDMKRRVSAA